MLLLCKLISLDFLDCLGGLRLLKGLSLSLFLPFGALYILSVY